MKKRLFDQSEGVTEYFHYDDMTDTSFIETVQDVEPHIEMAKAIRNNQEITKQGIKDGWWHIGHLPDVIILKMKEEDGVDVFDRNHWPKVGQLLNDKYSAFKLTDGKHKFKG